MITKIDRCLPLVYINTARLLRSEHCILLQITHQRNWHSTSHFLTFVGPHEPSLSVGMLFSCAGGAASINRDARNSPSTQYALEIAVRIIAWLLAYHVPLRRLSGSLLHNICFPPRRWVVTLFHHQPCTPISNWMDFFYPPTLQPSWEFISQPQIFPSFLPNLLRFRHPRHASCHYPPCQASIHITGPTKLLVQRLCGFANATA